LFTKKAWKAPSGKIALRFITENRIKILTKSSLGYSFRHTKMDVKMRKRIMFKQRRELFWHETEKKDEIKFKVKAYVLIYKA